MKILCGTDIIEIERIKKAIDSKGKRFLNKIFTENEINYCEAKGKNKYEHYAARFAAKEAIYKSISSNKRNYLEWKKIEILNDTCGKPKINLLYDVENLEQIDVSMSHCKTYATANVVAMYK